MRRYWLFVLFLWFFVMLDVSAGEGSNQGSLATHYVPPVIQGMVTFGAAPVLSANIKTLAGQRTSTDASGDYEITLDASGFYRVSVRAMLNVHVAMVEVFEDQTVILNVDLGTPCEISTWPSIESIAQMIACVNGNQPAPQP